MIMKFTVTLIILTWTFILCVVIVILAILLKFNFIYVIHSVLILMTVMEAIYRTKIIFHLKFPNTHIHTYTNTHTHTYTHTHTHTHTLTHTNTWKKILQPHPTPSFIPYRLTNLQNISIDGICGQLLMCIQNLSHFK